jgi:hypothetical protein
MIRNDTYGEITRGELADLRLHARKCAHCGLLATVDPVFHATRYGHAPTMRDERGTWIWNSKDHQWDVVKVTGE